MQQALLYGAEREWLWFPDDLSKKELHNPYFAIRKIFNKISLFEFRCDLEEWITYAYSNDTVLPEQLAFELPFLYDMICKLYSAAWAIWQVDGTHTYFRDSAKQENDLNDQKDLLENDHYDGQAV